MVYDAKRRAWQTGLSEVHITGGYYLPYEGEHIFEIWKGDHLSSWPVPAVSSGFTVGWRARIENTRIEPLEVLRIFDRKA